MMSLVKRILGLAFLISCYTSNSFAQTVVINEFMAENDTLTMITDEAYQYDDWIELFNLTNNPIDLSGYFLSDKDNELDKWSIPSGTIIPANGYLIVWADDDENQGALHSNFKLSKNGEFIALTSPNLVILDSISFGEQETSVAMARIPNGTGNFEERAPTFSVNNDGPPLATNPSIAKTAIFQIAPNPATNRVELTLESSYSTQANYQINIHSISGQVLFSKKDSFFKEQGKYSIDLQDFPPGLYFLEVQNNTTRFLQKLIIL